VILDGKDHLVIEENQEDAQVIVVEKEHAKQIIHVNVILDIL